MINYVRIFSGGNKILKLKNGDAFVNGLLDLEAFVDEQERQDWLNSIYNPYIDPFATDLTTGQSINQLELNLDKIQNSERIKIANKLANPGFNPMNSYDNLKTAKMRRDSLSRDLFETGAEFRLAKRDETGLVRTTRQLLRKDMLSDSYTDALKGEVRVTRRADRLAALKEGWANATNKLQGAMDKGLDVASKIAVMGTLMLDNATMGDKNFGGLSEAVDSAVHATSAAMLSSKNPWVKLGGVALEGANFLTKAGGLTVEGFDVNMNNSGYGNLGHYQSKSSRELIGLAGLNLSAIEKKLATRNELALMALKASNISDEIKFEQEARMNSVDDVIQLNKIALAGGVDTSLLAAKRGAKLVRLEEFRKERVAKAKYGRKLLKIEVSDKENILPTGALHKELNHLDEELDITKKGIPVILNVDDTVNTLEEIKQKGGELQQSAEIEALELLLNKELTDWIEDARKKWHESDEKDNDICEEVGKRLTKEILVNTKDDDKLIKQVDKDGKD